MHQPTSVLSPIDIEHPKCTACGVSMWLTRIEPDKPDHDKRTFECQACGSTTTAIVNRMSPARIV
jgi:hypothetical protein